MLGSVALIGQALTTCAEPLMVKTINTNVNGEHPYSYYTRNLPDARTLRLGEPGNCTDIAFAKKQELAKRSTHSMMFACNLKSGQGYAFLMLEDGRLLDSRFDEVAPFGEVGADSSATLTLGGMRAMGRV